MRLSVCFAFCLLCATAHAATVGLVRGIVHDPQHLPIPGAKVVLQAAHSTWSATTTTNPNGEFSFSLVPFGDYRLEVSAPGFAAGSLALSVTSATGPIYHLELTVASAAQTTTVTAATAGTNIESSTPTTSVSRTQLARTPGATQANSLAAITDFTPGAYMVHDQLHIRGGHQVSWLVDGVPVPNTNIASNVGPQFSPGDMDYLDIMRGSYDAGFGDRTYGVFNVVPRTGFESTRQVELDLMAGNFWQSQARMSLANHTERLAWFASLQGNRSSLGLETPSPEVLHDGVNGLSAFQSLIFNADPRDQFRLVASERRDVYQIPNTPAQNTAGTQFQHDAQRESDALANFSWVRTLSPSTLLTVSPFYHFNRADYLSSPADMPLATTDRRASSYAGAQATLDFSRGPETLELGGYGFGQHDNHLFALRFNDGSQPNLSQPQSASGQLEEVFAEEKYQPASWLTLMGGVRQSHFAAGLNENATSPRLGAALRLPHLGWVLRGNYGRYYQPPPLLTASGPLLQFVTSQDLGFVPLRGERDEEWQAGLTVPLRGWALDSDYFHIRARNYFDHNNVGNSDIFFPLTLAGARIYGFEGTLRSPQLWHRGGVHAAYSNQIAEGQGPITGGLTDFSPPTGFFLLDHDQRNTVSAGFDLNLTPSTFLSSNLYYGSGFANGAAPPAHLPGHASLDLSLGHSFSDSLTATATVLNLANTHLLTDNSVTFGGTHFNNPREFTLELRYRFHF